MDGYMIDVQCDEQTLSIHAKTKAAQRALTGWDVSVDDADQVQVESGSAYVEVPRSEIARVTFKNANPVINGNLVVVTTAGKKYQMHFRRKQRAGFAELARELKAAL